MGANRCYQIKFFAAMIPARFWGLLALLLLAGSPLGAQTDIQVIGDAVLTPAEIAEGAGAMFLLRFENNGQDTAYQVVIRDTLDPRFDANSLEMLGSSHNFELLRDGSNVVRWYFTNLAIPTSSVNAEESFGFILFTVQPNAFVLPYQVIGNRACITFNQQQSLCTNTAFVWIDTDAAIDEPDNDLHYKVVPNPNHGQFEIRASATNNSSGSTPTDLAEWWITDINGKTISDGLADDVQAASHQVLLEKPAPGLYLLWVKSKSDLKVQQFAIIR